eukprot:evm.model.scf_160EXC.3 EVM.evm.TU.scf_160EXC.3   scf_160EXC:55081-56055(-)
MAWAGELLRLLGARFPDAALERRYRKFRITRYFLRDDGLQAAVRAALIGAGAVRSLVNSGPTAGTAVMFVTLIAPLLQLAMRWLANRRGRTEAALAAYLWHRNAWAATSRVLLYPLFVRTWFIDIFQPSGPSTAWPGLLSYIFHASGAVIPFVTGGLYPVLMEHHLVIQPLSVLVIAHWQQGPFCEVALAGDSGPGHVLTAWRALEAGSRQFLAAMYMGEVPAAAEPDPLPACMHVVLALHVCVGLAATTYIAWLVEHTSRIHFLATEGWVGWMGWEPLGGLGILSQLAMGAGCLAVAWPVLGTLVLDRTPGAWEGGKGAADVT